MAKIFSPKLRTSFSFFAPEAQAVVLAADFTNWQLNATPLKKLKSGLWKTTLSLPPGTYEYRFLVDGEWQNDPECLARVANPYGAENCLRVII